MRLYAVIFQMRPACRVENSISLRGAAVPFLAWAAPLSLKRRVSALHGCYDNGGARKARPRVDPNHAFAAALIKGDFGRARGPSGDQPGLWRSPPAAGPGPQRSWAGAPMLLRVGRRSRGSTKECYRAAAEDFGWSQRNPAPL